MIIVSDGGESLKGRHSCIAYKTSRWNRFLWRTKRVAEIFFWWRRSPSLSEGMPKVILSVGLWDHIKILWSHTVWWLYGGGMVIVWWAYKNRGEQKLFSPA